MLIVVKFIENDKNSPKTLDFLKFYWAEKLNLKLQPKYTKDEPWGKNEQTIEYKKFKISKIYEYMHDKQRQILFMINWKIQTVQIMHFLDHYKSKLNIT